MSIHSDNFDDNSLAGFWDDLYDNDSGASSSILEQNQRLEMSGNTGAIAGRNWYAWVEQADLYPVLNEFDIRVKITDIYTSTSDTNSATGARLYILNSSSYYMVGITLYNNQILSYWEGTSIGNSNGSFEGSVPIWLRFLYNGITLYFYLSDNETDWTLIKSTNISNLNINYVSLDTFQYTYNNANKTGYVYYDDFTAPDEMYLKYRTEETPTPSIYSDNFNDNSLDTGIWTVTDDDSIISEQNQRLEFSKSSLAAIDAVSGYVTQSYTSGNFEVIIKVTDVTVTTGDVVQFYFVFGTAGGESGLDITIIKDPGPLFGGDDFSYQFFIDEVEGDSGSDSFPTFPIWLKIKYENEILYGYTSSDGENYSLLGSQNYSGASYKPDGLMLATNIFAFENTTTGHVYVDDFVVTYSSISETETIKLYNTEPNSKHIKVRYGEFDYFANVTDEVTHPLASRMIVNIDGANYKVLKQ